MAAAMPQLRDYQIRCVDQVCAALRRSRRVLLASPTGSGKTVMFAWLAWAIISHGARALILAHRQEIVDQISAAPAAVAVPHGLIAAGHPESEAMVQVASVMTLVRRLDRYAGQFDLVVCEECLHSAAASCSATPERLDGKPVSDIYRELVVGPSVADLVRDGWLSPAVTYAPPTALNLSGIRKLAGDYQRDALVKGMSERTLVGDAVDHYRQLSPQLPGLVYCCSIAHSQLVCEAFRGAGFVIEHVDGETPPAKRRAAIAAQAAGMLDLVSNVNLFTEGVDLPRLGCVLLLRPTLSLGLYLEMVGRALRTTPGKRRALILDHASNVSRHGLYDFPHCWSLDGRRKDPSAALVRRCPQCGVVVAIAALASSECGYQFVQPIRAPNGPGPVPEMVGGRLERVDDGDRWLLCVTRGGQFPYRRLLSWIAEPEDLAEQWQHAERARRINRYHSGWIGKVLQPPSQREPRAAFSGSAGSVGN